MKQLLNFFLSASVVKLFQSISSSLEVVGQNGLEPSTSRLSVVCSSQLSYWPLLVEISGIEPLTSCLQGRRSPSWAKPPFSLPLVKVHLLLRYLLNWITLRLLSASLTDLRMLQNESRSFWVLLRKEVIQPHVLIRLPCYDFTPITSFTFGGVLLAVRLRTSGVPDSHGVTGGVYKARERIHRGILIRDY